MSYPNMGKLLGNMRNAFAPSQAHATVRPDGQGAEHYDLPPETEPSHVPHEPENKEQYEVRLALAPIQAAIEHMTAFGAILAKSAENVQRIYQSPYYEPATISATKFYRVAEHKRNHVACLVGAAQTINAFIPGVGSIAFNLSIGWNQLDFPPGTEITASAANFNALFLYSMDRVANA